MNQNEEHEDMLFEEKKKKPEFREAGMDANGEFSMESLKRWFKRGRWGAGCLWGSCLPDGDPDGGKEPEGIPDHGSELRYSDEIYHEPAWIGLIRGGNDGEIERDSLHDRV